MSRFAPTSTLGVALVNALIDGLWGLLRGLWTPGVTVDGGQDLDPDG